MTSLGSLASGAKNLSENSFRSEDTHEKHRTRRNRRVHPYVVYVLFLKYFVKSCRGIFGVSGKVDVDWFPRKFVSARTRLPLSPPGLIHHCHRSWKRFLKANNSTRNRTLFISLRVLTKYKRQLVHSLAAGRLPEQRNITYQTLLTILHSRNILIPPHISQTAEPFYSAGRGGLDR